MKFLLLFLTTISLLCAHAQSEKYIYLGKEAEAQGKLYEACRIYNSGISEKKVAVELYFRLGECLRQLNDYEQAEQAYYKTISKDTLSLFPDALNSLAAMQKQNGKYAQALSTYETILRLNREQPMSTAYLKAQQEIIACTTALKKEFPSYSYQVKNALGLNSKDAEFAPTFYDTASIVFSTLPGVYDNPEKKGEFIELKSATKQAGKWVRAGRLPEGINTFGEQNANGCFTPDRKFFYFTRCVDGNNCGIYVCTYDKGKFGKAFPLKINLEGYNTTQPMVADRADGQILFFSSNRSGGYGGYDIWYCLVDKNHELSAPINLGIVNSPEDEISPFFFEQTKELFFSSTWHAGLGGYDIFKSSTTDYLKFTAPQNIGLPYNSPANDYYFTLSGQGYKGMLSSNREGSLSTFGKTCCNDIYEFDYPYFLLTQPTVVIKYEPKIDTPTVYQLYRELKDLLPIKLYFHNDEPNPKSLANFTLLSYTDAYQSYQLQKGTYQNANPKKTPILYNEYVDKEYLKLNRFLQLTDEILKKGGGLDFGIAGFASPLAKSTYNINLTSRRIESFINEVKNFNNGSLITHYLSGKYGQARLNIKKIPNGETKSAKGVSDDYYNQKKSVYSLEAAKERRIELLTVVLNNLPDEPLALPNISKNSKNNQARNGNLSLTPDKQTIVNTNDTLLENKEVSNNNDTAVNTLKALDKTEPLLEEVFLNNEITVDLGKIKKGDFFEKKIRFRNTYGQNLTFSRVKTSCGCTGLKVPNQVVVPDEETEFTLVFDPKNKNGVYEGTAQIFTKELLTTITIKFKVEVER